MHMVVMALITCSPPALIISAVMFSAPLDFPFLNNFTAASTSQRMVKSSSIAGWLCDYCLSTSCIMSIEFHAVFHPAFYNILMVSQRLSIFICDAADLSLLHICHFLDLSHSPSHLISSLVVFHLSTLDLDPVFFSLYHFLSYFSVNLPVLFSTFFLTFALLLFSSSFITKVKYVCCDPRLLFVSILTKYFLCSFYHCHIKM